MDIKIQYSYFIDAIFVLSIPGCNASVCYKTETTSLISLGMVTRWPHTTECRPVKVNIEKRFLKNAHV